MPQVLVSYLGVYTCLCVLVFTCLKYFLLPHVAICAKVHAVKQTSTPPTKYDEKDWLLNAILVNSG